MTSHLIKFCLLALVLRVRGQMIRAGINVPTSLTTTLSDNGKTGYFLFNIDFTSTYYVIGFEFYAAKSGNVTTKVDAWSTAYCGPSSSNPSCRDYLISTSVIYTIGATRTNIAAFSLSKGYNYCVCKAVKVKAANTIELVQNGIVAIDTSGTYAYSDYSYSTSGWILTLKSLSSKGVFYVTALLSATDPGYSGAPFCSSSSSSTSTSTTTAGSPGSTSETISSFSTSTAIATAVQSSTSFTLQPTTTETMSSQVTVNFDSTMFLALIESGYTGDLSSCLVNCTNQGQCYIDTLTNALGCLCATNYAGDSCQTDTRACSSNPCLNGAECFDSSTLPRYFIGTNLTFFCNCSSAYYGTKCELRYDLCRNVTCSYQGTCSDEGVSANCSCFYGYEGQECQFEDDSLKLAKRVISVSSVLAAVLIALFYGFFLLNDLHTCWIRRARRRQRPIKRPTIQAQPRHVFRPVYRH